jgi:hypothetical protein
MAAGIEKHGLAGLSEDLSAPEVRGQAKAVGEAETGFALVQNDENLMKARANLELRTGGMGRRLAGIIRGHYGTTSAQLDAYGLNVRAERLTRRRKTDKPDKPDKQDKPQ